MFGTVWVVLGFLSLYYSAGNHWTSYGYLFVSVLYLTTYMYKQYNQYLTIKNNSIKVNTPFGKKMRLSEINWIKKFAGDYILISENSKLKIDTDLIEKRSLEELNGVLAELNLPANKTPFANNG
jgi:hypothetical protein